MLFSQKSHPRSSNAVPPYRFCFCCPCIRCRGRKSPDEEQLGGVTTQKRRSPQVWICPLLQLCCCQAQEPALLPKASGPGGSSSGYTKVIANQEENQAEEGSSHQGCCRKWLSSQTSGKHARVLQGAVHTSVPVTGSCHRSQQRPRSHGHRQPGPALVTQSPRQGCGKGFLLELSTKLETGKGTRCRRASEPRTPHQPQGGRAVGDPQCRLTTGGHQRTQPGREAREKALPSPPAAGTGRLTFPAASPPAPSQPQPISRPQTPSRGWVASGFIPQRPENAPAIAEPLQKPPAQGPVVPGLVGGGVRASPRAAGCPLFAVDTPPPSGWGSWGFNYLRSILPGCSLPPLWLEKTRVGGGG